jgi:hypothetical protein
MNVWQLWRTAPCQEGRAFQELPKNPSMGASRKHPLFGTIRDDPEMPFLARHLDTLSVHEESGLEVARPRHDFLE